MSLFVALLVEIYSCVIEIFSLKQDKAIHFYKYLY